MHCLTEEFHILAIVCWHNSEVHFLFNLAQNLLYNNGYLESPVIADTFFSFMVKLRFKIGIINIWPEWQFFNVAGYLYVIEESRDRL